MELLVCDTPEATSSETKLLLFGILGVTKATPSGVDENRWLHSPVVSVRRKNKLLIWKF